MFVKNKNIKLLVNYGIGPVLFLWLSWSLWRQIQRQPNLDETLYQLKNSFTGVGVWKLLCVLLLMLVNWGLEARKWQLLLTPVEHIRFLKAFRAVLTGIAFSVNTPNRIGEYGGRVLHVQPGHRWQAASLTVAGSFSQLIVTLLMGMGGLLFLLNSQQLISVTANYSMWLKVLFYNTALAHVMLLLVYFKLGVFVRLLEKIPYAKTVVKHVVVIEHLPVTILLKILLWSTVRYIVFVLQYILLLQLFGVIMTLAEAYWLISVLYLVMAIIPTIALAEIGIRGEVSKLLFGMISANTLGIVAATVSIWLINLILPAIAGSLLFLGTRIVKYKRNED
jgi:hypothetical protein